MGAPPLHVLPLPPQVRLAMPGYRSRYYRKCFDAEVAEGAELESLVSQEG